MTERSWTDDQLVKAVLNSYTISDVSRKLGLNPKHAGNRVRIKNRIKDLELDIRHFTGKCHQNRSKRRPIEHYLVQDISCDTKSLKLRLIREKILEEKCFECGCLYWCKRKLSLHLDHINGNNRDNRLENLRLLCPNCHSLTDTYCKGTRTKNINLCIDCRCEITKYSKRCCRCNAIYKHSSDSCCTTNWPPLEELKSMVSSSGYSKVGELFGVSGNAVKKKNIY